MDNPGDVDAGESSAVNSKIQPMKPSDQEITTHEACGHYPYRDWCRACVGSAGRSDAEKRRHEEQNSLLVASMDYGFFTDGDDGEHTRGATPFLVNLKPTMMIWSTPVQCKGVDDQEAIKETVKSLNRLGFSELIVRSDNEPAMLAFRNAVIRELKERFGVRAIAQAPPKYDSASAGTVENAIKQVKEKVRTLVAATRELHGVVMDLEHVALAWCVRFAGQIIFRTVKGADGLTAFQRAFQRASHPRAMSAAWRERILYLEPSKKKVQITDKFLDCFFLGIREGSEEFFVGTPAGCVVCRTVKRRPREDAADPVFFFSTASLEHPGDRCQMTSRENQENQESNRCESMYVLCN